VVISRFNVLEHFHHASVELRLRCYYALLLTQVKSAALQLSLVSPRTKRHLNVILILLHLKFSRCLRDVALASRVMTCSNISYITSDPGLPFVRRCGWREQDMALSRLSKLKCSVGTFSLFLAFIFSCQGNGKWLSCQGNGFECSAHRGSQSLSVRGCQTVSLSQSCTWTVADCCNRWFRKSSWVFVLSRPAQALCSINAFNVSKSSWCVLPFLICLWAN